MTTRVINRLIQFNGLNEMFQRVVLSGCVAFVFGVSVGLYDNALAQSSLIQRPVTRDGVYSISKDKLYFHLGNNAWLRAQKGEDWMSRGRYVEAIDEFKRALQMDDHSPLSASIYHNLGLSYRAVGAYPLAIVSHQRAMRLNPNFEMYAYHLAVTLEASGGLTELSRAYELLAQWQTVYPDNMELRSMSRYLKERAQHAASQPLAPKVIQSDEYVQSHQPAAPQPAAPHSMSPSSADEFGY